MSDSPLLRELQDSLRDAWQRITQDERDAIARSASAIARMTLRKSLGETISGRTQREIKAQLANLEALTQLRLNETIRDAITRVLGASAKLVADALTSRL